MLFMNVYCTVIRSVYITRTLRLRERERRVTRSVCPPPDDPLGASIKPCHRLRLLEAEHTTVIVRGEETLSSLPEHVALRFGGTSRIWEVSLTFIPQVNRQLRRIAIVRVGLKLSKGANKMLRQRATDDAHSHRLTAKAIV